MSAAAPLQAGDLPAAPPSNATMTDVATVPYETASAEEEGKHLNYVGHQIPWAVRLIWVIFWSASAWYVIRWLLPALQVELITPP